jgi:hypothetical protein
VHLETGNTQFREQGGDVIGLRSPIRVSTIGTPTEDQMPNAMSMTQKECGSQAVGGSLLMESSGFVRRGFNAAPETDDGIASLNLIWLCWRNPLLQLVQEQ